MGKITAIALLSIAFLSGCKQAPRTDFKPLDQVGMWFGKIEELRGLQPTDTEITNIVRLKQAGISDAACIELVAVAHAHHHPFESTDAVVSLAGAGFGESDILEVARMDQLEAWSGEAVTLRLTGLSDKVVLDVAHRRAKNLPTLSAPEIGRLKNLGLSEAQILDRINRGMTDAQAEAEIAAHRRAANASGFVHNHGRRR